MECAFVDKSVGYNTELQVGCHFQRKLDGYIFLSNEVHVELYMHDMSSKWTTIVTESNKLLRNFNYFVRIRLRRVLVWNENCSFSPNGFLYFMKDEKLWFEVPSRGQRFIIVDKVALG